MKRNGKLLGLALVALAAVTARAEDSHQYGDAEPIETEAYQDTQNEADDRTKKDCQRARKRDYSVTVEISQVTDGKAFGSYVTGHARILEDWGGKIGVRPEDVSFDPPPVSKRPLVFKAGGKVKVVQRWPSAACFDGFFKDSRYNPPFVQMRHQSTKGTAIGSDQKVWDRW